jgi:hypothetical protein
MKKKFEIGQRVEMVKDCCHAKVGMRGTIIGYDTPVHDYQVKFDKKFPGGHSCNGKCKDGYGHHVDERHIKLIDTVYTTKYKPGDEVTVRSDLTYTKQYYMTDGKNYMYPTDQMLTKRGKKVKIKSVTKTGKYMIEGSIFPWVDEMFVDEAEVKPTGKKYKVGDHVKVLLNGKEKTGVIRRTESEECFYGVEMDDPDFKGHNCGGFPLESGSLIHSGRGNWFDSGHILGLVDKTSTCKFKVGDKVRAIDNYYGFTTLRRKWVGIVTSTYGDDFADHNFMAKGVNDGDTYGLNDSHFELVKEEPKKRDWNITITPDGEKTIATYYEGDKVVKTVYVTRYHEDVYDPEVAAMFVTQKLFAEGRSIITVQFDSGSRKYDYLSKGLDIKRGDRVIVPTGEDNHHVPATVTAIQPFAEDKLHVPLSKMKYVIRVAEDEKPKFKVGDIVIAKKTAPYGITRNGWRGEVVRVKDATWITVKNGYTRGDGYMVRSEYFDLAKDQTKYYNGKVVCVSQDGIRAITVGKVYEFVDGNIKELDNGCRHWPHENFKTLEEYNKKYGNVMKFAPFVE